MNTCDIKNIMSENPQLRDKLFARGFYFTDDKVNDFNYPFYGLWKKEKISNYTIMVNPKQTYYIKSLNGKSLILIGHAYNPFSLIADENIILQELLDAEGSTKFWNTFNELTGVFTLIGIHNKQVYLVGDPSCMQCAFYTNRNEHIYIASHTCLLGDLLSLDWNPYVKKMSQYRFFHLLGNALPGNLTQFSEVERMVPNHYIVFSNNKTEVKRFYWPISSDKVNTEIEREAAYILHNNLKLIALKWNKPAISMTGGCDSKTTLACANGLYDKFSYFSYISSESEAVDAKAAHEICINLGLEHTVYNISEHDTDFDGIEETRHILEWNTGDIIPINRNDVRKRKFFEDILDFDVEVKSWGSEIGRSYYSKRFNGRKNFGIMPTPRKCTTLYKFFLNNRKLVRETDRVFGDYLDKYFEQAKTNSVQWQEQFFWEYRIPSWNGVVITGEHRYSFDITIPYNNRKLLELFLGASIDDRINDVIYRNIRQLMNPQIDKIGMSVTNLKHTKNRAKMENLYYILHSNAPF